MTWNYTDVKKAPDDVQLLVCLKTENEVYTQMTVAKLFRKVGVLSQGVVKYRGVDITRKVYAWRIAPDMAPLVEPKEKIPELRQYQKDAIDAMVGGNLVPYLGRNCPTNTPPAQPEADDEPTGWPSEQ